MLTSLVLLPALGSLVIGILGPARDRMAAALAITCGAVTLGVAGWAAIASPSSLSVPDEIHSWIPILGASIRLGADGLSLILVVWVALASALTLGLTRPDARTAALVLLLEAALAGLFLARDVLLVLASVGVMAVSAALLSTTPRKILRAESVGLTVLLGWFVVHYRRVYAQTGFVSTELARWKALVLYPDEQGWLFLLGALGAVCLVPALVVALDTASRPGRLVLSSVVVTFAPYFIVRILVPLGEPAAESTAPWVGVAAVILTASTVLARGWGWVAAGYQGVVLFGLFSFHEAGVSGALLMMIAVAAGGFGLLLSPSRAVSWIFTLLLVGVPVVCVLGFGWTGDGFLASAGTIAFTALAYRLVTLVRAGAIAPTRMNERRGRWLVVVTVLLWIISMGIGHRSWERWVSPAARAFAIETSAQEPEESS